jgi:non-ribosomal peptide synthetase component F
MVERSLEIIIGIMGILKAGGAYLPIDPEYPIDRIEYLLEDSQAILVITQREIATKFKLQTKALCLEEIKFTAMEIGTGDYHQRSGLSHLYLGVNRKTKGSND